MRLAASLAVTALLALLAASPSAADRTTADFYVQRGEKALRERDWNAARDHFKKAIEEDPTHVPAHGGLAESFLGAGDRGAGVAALRDAVRLAETATPAPSSWAGSIARLKKRLAEVDTIGVALDRLTEKYVADVLAYADRWLAKDPDASLVAVAEVLRVRPGHGKAKALEAKLAKAEAAAWIQLFNGRDRMGWDWLDSREWFITDGVLVGTIQSGAAIGKTSAKFQGDFDVRMEAKVVERHGDLACMTLLAPWTSDYAHSSFGILADALVWQEELGKDKYSTALSLRPSQMKKPFDPAEWTVYEMRFRGDECVAAINGEVVGTVPRLKDRTGGAIGLRVQHVKAHFRRIEVRLR